MDLLSTVAFWSFTLAIPFAFGAAVVRRLCGRELDVLAHVAWSWIAGTLFVGLLTWVWIALAAPLAVLPLVAGAAAAVALARAYLRPGIAPLPQRPRLPLAVTLTCVVVLVPAADEILFASATPVTIGDEGNIFANRAKALYVAGALDDRYRELMNPTAATIDHPELWFVLHPEYPPLNPLLQVWTFANAGGIVHVENRTVIQGFTLALLLLLASALGRSARSWLAVLVLIVAAEAHVTRAELGVGNADPMTALGLLAAIDAGQRLLSGWRMRHALLLSVALTFLLLAKQEGQMFAAVVGALVGLAILRRRSFALLAPLALPAAAWLATALMNARLGYASELLATAAGRSFVERVFADVGARLAVIGRAAWETCGARPAATGWLFLALVVVACAAPRDFRRERWLPLLTVAVGALGFTVIFLGTPHEIEWHVATALSRLVYLMLPVTALCVAAGLDRMLPRRRTAAVEVAA